MSARRWWNDEQHRAELEAKVGTGSWRVVANKRIPGRVIKIIYAGYKIALPDDTEQTVNPDTMEVIDAEGEAYDAAVLTWQASKDEVLRQKAEQKAAEEAKIALQNSCLHTSSTHQLTAAAAGCDVYETTCDTCQRCLRRSWSTAYDNDPDDHVADWDWWCREYNKLYGSQPNRANYVIDENMR